MIEREGQPGQLSVKRQCELLDLSRSGVYYTPRAVCEQDLQLMRRIDQLHFGASVLWLATYSQTAGARRRWRPSAACRRADATHGD